MYYLLHITYYIIIIIIIILYHIICISYFTPLHFTLSYYITISYAYIGSYTKYILYILYAHNMDTYIHMIYINIYMYHMSAKNKYQDIFFIQLYLLILNSYMLYNEGSSSHSFIHTFIYISIHLYIYLCIHSYIYISSSLPLFLSTSRILLSSGFVVIYCTYAYAHIIYVIDRNKYRSSSNI